MNRRILSAVPLFVKNGNRISSRIWARRARTRIVATTRPPTSGPLFVVKRNEQEFYDTFTNAHGFMSMVGTYNEERLRFEGYQTAFLRSRAPFRCIEKSRQTGYSFSFACEAVGRNHMADKQTSIFVSYNLDDAKEKITYARQLYEELPLEFQKKLVTDSKTELGFQSNGPAKRISRIISSPSKAPRGKNGDIYLDELAHYRNDREVYKGSTALIMRSHGQLTVCSSPLGRRGLFWEIARQETRPYPGYWRQSVPWWLCSFFCKDVKRAAIEAPEMATEERVRAFGKHSGGIIGQFESMAIEDFQEEFEVIYQDETMSFYPYSLILGCTADDLELVEDVSELGRAQGRLTAGYDVGRKKDTAELTVFEENGVGLRTMRYAATYDKTPFAMQEAALRELLYNAAIAKLRIDGTGMGAHLAENLAIDFPDIIEVVEFSQPKKETLATDFKIALQSHNVLLPADKKLVRQIHSIKKRISPQGKAIFEVEGSTGNKKEIGHADKFWSVALATSKDRGPPERTTMPVGVTIIGE